MRYRLQQAAGLLAAALMFFNATFASAETKTTTAATPTVKISPGYTDVGVNGTVQYSAAVTGLSNTAVTWLVSNVKGGDTTNGTITAAGLYKAPAQVPSNGVTIEALASDNKTMDVVYVNVAPVGPAISAIAPSPIPAGNFTVTITGKAFVSGAVAQAGGIALNTTFVSATSLKASGWQGSAGTVAFQVRNPGSLYGPAFNATFTGGSSSSGGTQTISPTSATVKLKGTQQFTSDGATSWTATAGTISTSGLYTAPETMPASSTVTIKVTGSKGTANATVTLSTGTPQTVSPATASVNLGATQQFTSAGATSWTASAGTISASGLYTAPATLPASGTVAITAKGPNGTGNATVTLVPPTPVITAVGNGTLPLGAFTATISGSGFASQSVAKLNGSALTTTYSNGQLTVSGYAAQSGAGSVTVTTVSATSKPFSVTVGVANAKASAAAARRLLQQAAFGPTPSDAAHVQQVGIPAWLNEQYALKQVSTYSGITSSQGGMPPHFLTMAVSNADQLRQRVGFALSQIWVTSIDKLIWNDNMTKYQDMLMADAFGNYRQIMYDVTVSPAMGQYLDMANNAKADPKVGSLANENYARELMQLFTLGTVKLNSDGSVQTDANKNPLPTYTQANVAEFARVFTGWTYADAKGQPAQWDGYMTSYGPMAPYPAQHDTGVKTLLNGGSSPAGVSAQQDLNNALDNIFNHPNVGPFVSRLLIQHLVKSNPSPAYIGRVAAAFNNNGSGVRGDMKAVLNAIFMDSEARANDEGGSDQAADGHLQEPALFITGMVRAFAGTMNDQNYYQSDLDTLGQDLFDAPSVFNYYSPNYHVPGGSLIGPEFQINTPNNAIVRSNLVAALMFSQYQKATESYGPGTAVDLTPFVSLAANPATLVDALDLTLTRGVMPAQMKSALVSAVNADSNGNVHRVQMACYVILTSNYYNVWH